jgi:6-phosphogluconolactonase
MWCVNQPAAKGSAIILLAMLAALSACGGSGDSGPSEGTAGGDPSVSATVTGLTGQGLVLELNGSQDLPVAADGTVTFPNGLALGDPYSVSIVSQPSTRREICGVTQGSGYMGQSNVTNVTVTCSIVEGFLYQATYTSQLNSYGITAGSGALVQFATPLTTGTNPTSMVTAPGGRFLYVAIPIDSGTSGAGSISIYAVDSDTGSLTAVSSVDTPGLKPTRLAIAPNGAFLFVMGDSALAVYAVDATSGALTATGSSVTLNAVWAPALAVRADGKFLYVLTGDFSSNTPAPASLTAYAIDPTTGALTAGPALTWMTNGSTSPGSSMALDPLGRFLYLASYQGDVMQAAATVLPYAIDPVSGALTPIGTGTQVVSSAGTLTVDPTGHYLYATNSLNSDAANDTVLALAIDQGSGAVTALGMPLETDGSPQEVICDPTARFVFIGMSSAETNDLSAFAVSSSGSSAGQLVLSGSSGPTAESMALAVVE